jgi:hypothetical protein
MGNPVLGPPPIKLEHLKFIQKFDHDKHTLKRGLLFRWSRLCSITDFVHWQCISCKQITPSRYQGPCRLIKQLSPLLLRALGTIQTSALALSIACNCTMYHKTILITHHLLLSPIILHALVVSLWEHDDLLFAINNFIWRWGMSEGAHFSHPLLEIDAPMTLSRLPGGWAQRWEWEFQGG